MLPVMDNKNKAMKKQAYTYQTSYGEKTVEAATMFDINTAIMRCLVKNIALFGFAINVYKGEDLPLDDKSFVSDAELVTKSLREKAINIVRAAFENPGDKDLQTRLEGARKWAVKNNIIEVQDEILKQEEIVKKEEIIEVEEVEETQKKENEDVGS